MNILKMSHILSIDPGQMRKAGHAFFEGAMRSLMSETGTVLENKHTGEKLGKIFSGMVESLVKHFNAGPIGKATGGKFTEVMNSFLSEVHIAEGTKAIGKETAQAIHNVADPALDEIVSVLSTAFATLNKKTMPWILGGIVLTSGTPLVMKYIYERAVRNLRRPKLAIKVRVVTRFTSCVEELQRTVSSLFREQANKKEVAPIFNAEIQRKITDITQALKHIRNNGGYFQNLLLFGPGGTGKTMISEKISKDANVNYIMMSGGDLAQYIKHGEHVTELNKLFEKIKNASNPTILFIDEFESLGKDRSKITGAELLELQNAFLNHTGTQSKKLMIIAATNRESDLDPAILTRFDYKIFIGPPALKERIEIISDYLPQFFSSAERIQFFAKDVVQAIALKIEGFSGRVIFKMLNAIYCKKASTADHRLTRKIIDQTVDDFIQQEKPLEKSRDRGLMARVQESVWRFFV